MIFTGGMNTAKPGARTLLALLLSLACLVSPPAVAQEPIPPRLQIGVNLLPAVIAANKGLATIPSGQHLQIYMVHRGNDHLAEQLKRSIGRIGLIKKRRLDTEVRSIDELLADDIEPMSTIFIVEPMEGRLDELIEYAHTRRVLLFSPLKGDVGKGVATGFKVTDRVRPLVNLESLRQSKIQLKAFFLRIAVKHE
jgi:hypothetical protein